MNTGLFDNNKPERDRGQANMLVPAFTGKALASLDALKNAFLQVDLSTGRSRQNKPFLFYKARPNLWVHGQRQIEAEPGVRWAVNVSTVERGYICWGPGNKKLGEEMTSILEEMPNRADLPDHGFPWKEQWSVELLCLDGRDAGLEVVFATSTDGGIEAAKILAEEVRDRLCSEHGGRIIPVCVCESYSYQHPEFGLTWKPDFRVIDWVLPDGPPPAPAPTSPSPTAEQPRRRRVA